MTNNIIIDQVLNADLQTAIGVYMILVTFFGLYVAFKVRRVLVYRIKLLFVYSLPLVLAFAYIDDRWDVGKDYRLLLMCTFITFLHILYWREIRYLTTSIGYHRTSLVKFLDILPDMVWMKDTENRFTYTNQTIRDGLLHCTEKEAFGKTGVELAEVQRSKGHRYTFGEICTDSDMFTMDEGKVCRFMEFGEVNGKFLALQVFKAPLYMRNSKNQLHLIGTIGMGRDLTGEFIDHQRISELLEEGDIVKIKEVFQTHLNRYLFTGNSLYLSHDIMDRRIDRRKNSGDRRKNVA